MLSEMKPFIEAIFTHCLTTCIWTLGFDKFCETSFRVTQFDIELFTYMYVVIVGYLYVYVSVRINIKKYLN